MWVTSKRFIKLQEHSWSKNQKWPFIRRITSFLSVHLYHTFGRQDERTNLLIVCVRLIQWGHHPLMNGSGIAAVRQIWHMHRIDPQQPHPHYSKSKHRAKPCLDPRGNFHLQEAAPSIRPNCHEFRKSNRFMRFGWMDSTFPQENISLDPTTQFPCKPRCK